MPWILKAIWLSIAPHTWYIGGTRKHVKEVKFGLLPWEVTIPLHEKDLMKNKFTPKTTYAHMWKLQHEAIWGHNNSHQYLSMNFKRLHIKIALKIQESSLFHHDFSLPSGHCNGSTMLQCYHVPKTACFNQHCLGPNNCWILRNKFPHQKHTGKSSHNHDFGQDMHVHTNIRPKCKASICQLAIRTSRQGFFPTMQCLCTYLSCTNSCCKSITNAWNEQ